MIAPEPIPLETQRDAAWKLEEFVQEVNMRIAAMLPSDQYDARQREDFSIRLLRHYSSLGLVDESERVGREALYRYRHLLQVLSLRTLQREGWNSKAIAGFNGRDSGELEAFLSERDPNLDAMPAAALEEPQARQSAPLAAAPNQYLSQKSAKLETALPKVMAQKFSASQPLEPDREESKRESALDFLDAVRARRSAVPTQQMPAPLPAFLLHDPPRPPERWKRIEIAPGLELHISDRYRRARSSNDKQRLLEVIGTTLETAILEPSENT